jgi:hypothetical protein
MKRKVLSVLAVVGLTLAARAQADVKDFTNYCNVVALRSCASVVVETAPDGNGGTVVIMRLRNLQGTHSLDNTGGSMITNFGLTAPLITGAANLSVTTQGAVGTVGNPVSFWKIFNTPVNGAVTFSAGVNTLQGGNTPSSYLRGGIMGCDNAYFVPTTYFQTCGANSGWVVFSFTTTNAWSANDAQIVWRAQGVVANNGGNKGCRSMEGAITSVNQWEYCAPAQVVPEPITMALLGSGLASLGGVGLFRRRRGNTVTGG